jgi:hypothetical protein
MKIIDNISHLLGDDIKSAVGRGDRLKVAASCFSIFAFEALKAELEKVDGLDFIFTSPAFLPDEVTDQVRRERREFFIPKVQRERSVYGSEFEIQLRNKMTQRAVARECAQWIRKKARFRSNAKSIGALDSHLRVTPLQYRIQSVAITAQAGHGTKPQPSGI